MRVPLLALLLAGCAPAAAVPGGGIVSVNPCADQLLLALVPPERIAAISHYSQDPGATSIPLDQARRFRATSGTAEEVIALKPDLVVASSFTPPATRAAFARVGLKTLYLDSPTTIAASKTQVTELAASLGAEPQGRALNARIDRAMAAASPGQPVPALLFIGGAMASGGGNLLDEMLREAGFTNAAADYGLQFTGTLSVEAIAAHPPALLLVPDGEGRVASARRRLLAATRTPVREAAFPRSMMNCGGPTIPAAMARLAEIRREIGR